ncbi:MAG TPA: lipoprotein-releasing ABC transporter permease subunit [Aestuariivirgaceae bacterium]|nr:lipoprotein-releasing ABC transporter permease subunit [Aestuariivirgaceae bacterium]
MTGEVGDTRPFSAFERLVARRYLRARRREGFISVIAGFSFLGIMLGVATLIIVMAVMNGFRGELLAKVLGYNGHAMVYSALGDAIPDFDREVEALLEVPGVVKAMPFLEAQVMASSLRANSGALVRGIRERDLKALTSVNNERLSGTFDGFDLSGGVAVGYRLAWKHGLELGDSLMLISPDGPETILGTTPRMRSFEVVAVFEIGMSEYDSSVIYMPLEAAQEYFLSEGDVSAIELMVEDPDAIDSYLSALQERVGPGLRFVTWKRTNQTFFSALEVERNVMFVILTLIILVAALNVISGLIMLVKDKGRDIAILRTMGATRGAIQRIFFMTGAAIGTAGTLAGLLLGIVVSLNVEHIRQFLAWLTGTELFPPELYYLSQLPSDLDPGQTAAVVVMALALSFLATLYPSLRAARLDPVEALRYE